MRTPTTAVLRRAVLLGLLLAGLAHLAPLHLAQTLDAALIELLADRVSTAERDVIVVDLGKPDALSALAAAPVITVVGPGIAVGNVAPSVAGETAAWLLALASVASLLMVSGGHRAFALLVAGAGPALLVAGSGIAFAAGNWIPVTGPALVMFLTGALTFAMLRGVSPAVSPPPSRSPTADVARSPGDAAVEAWQRDRDRPVTNAQLPKLHALGCRLAAEGHPELAADAFFRVAQVDPDFGDTARRLVRVGRSEAECDAIDALRARMPNAIGRYRLIEPIGSGTTGRVFLAKDPNINRLIALKLIDLAFERDRHEAADAAERFRREAETTGRLSHPNIVTIHDTGESDGSAFIAMEFLKGTLLSRFTTTETLLPVPLVIELAARTADALDYAHCRNVIHRDIKPGNIMYDSVGGDLKITDFGIARLVDVNRTRTGVVLGTPSFMAPEQIVGGNVKGYTDLFALGVSLYELLTGRLPFRESSMAQLMFVIANEPHVPVSTIRPGLPAGIDAVVDKALSKDPADRFQRGRAMAEALRGLIAPRA